MEFQEIKTKMARKRSRKKGHDFERWVAVELRKLFPNARRHLEFQKGEANGVDISNTGQYRIQCKKTKKYASISAIEEVQCHDWLGDIPVLITAGDGKPPLVVLPFAEFVRLVERDLEDAT